MKKIYLLCSISLILTAWAAGKSPVRDEVLKLLPSDLATLSATETRKALEEKFSKKIQKKDDPKNLYLHYFADKNDVTIGTKDGLFEYTYIEFPRSIIEKSAGFYASVVDQLTAKQKKEVEASNKKISSHETGRFIQIDLPEQGLKLEFVNNEKKDLRSVIIFNAKEK